MSCPGVPLSRNLFSDSSFPRLSLEDAEPGTIALIEWLLPVAGMAQVNVNVWPNAPLPTASGKPQTLTFPNGFQLPCFAEMRKVCISTGLCQLAK